MLVLIIHKDKNRYYVNLSKKDNKNVLSVICANSNETKCLTKEEASSLFNELYMSDIRHYSKEKIYVLLIADKFSDQNKVYVKKKRKIG